MRVFNQINLGNLRGDLFGGVTATVIALPMALAFGVASGVVVDTHVARLSRRLGLTTEKNAERIERDLMALFPAESWVPLGHRLILHGRRGCTARKPACDACPLIEFCHKVGM